MRVDELDIEVEDCSDFEGYAEEIVDALCEDLKNRGMTRPIEEDDCVDPDEYNFQWLWTDKASKIISAEIDRMYTIGKKYFPDDEFIEINPSMYREI